KSAYCRSSTAKYRDNQQARLENGRPGEYIHYAASKAALDAFTLGLAREVAATGTRVCAVAPGTTHTDIHATAGEPDRPARVLHYRHGHFLYRWALVL